MRLIKNLLTKLFKQKKDNEPWLKFYSREERSIEFTDKSIYHYMIDEVGEDKDFIVIMNFLIILMYVHELLEVLE